MQAREPSKRADEYDAWCRPYLSEKQYVYVWADGIHVKVRLEPAPKIAVGFWAALRKIFPSAREQRYWVHKTANVLNNLPKSVQPKAKSDLHEIWQAETKADAEQAFDHFLEQYGRKYPKACECFQKDRDMLLPFYDSRPSTGGICEQRTPSSRRSRAFDSVIARRKATARGAAAWRGYSSWLSPLPSGGGEYGATKRLTST